jgi:hypothetical protein
MNKWIDCNESRVGDVGWLIQSVDQNRGGASSWYLSDTPGRTNRSRQPRVFGWLGETNNVSSYARGIARAIKVNKAGDRLLVEILDGAEQGAELEAMGYPELIAQPSVSA